MLISKVTRASLSNQITYLRPTKMAEVPEENWVHVASYLSLAEISATGVVSRLVLKSFESPSLPSRQVLDLGTMSSDNCAIVLRKCPHASSLRAVVVGGGLQLPSTFERLDLTFRRHQPSLPPALPLLRSLCLSNSLCDERCIETLRACSMPLLEELGLYNGWEIDDWTQCADIVSSFPALRRVAMPFAGGARSMRKSPNGREFDLTFNSLTKAFLPPITIVCANCGEAIFKNLSAYLVGPPTQNHITFELFTDQEPDASSVAFQNFDETQRNCRNNCHSERSLHLVARHFPGSPIDTRDFRYAVACGPDLAVVLSHDGRPLSSPLPSSSRNLPRLLRFFDYFHRTR